MINLVIGMIIGTYFSKYTRPIFENVWSWCMTKYVEFKTTKVPSDKSDSK